MEKSLFLVLCIAAICLPYYVTGQGTLVAPVIQQDCLGCLCEASSGCNMTIGCPSGSGTYLCGPFLISWPYWADAGKFILAGDNPDRKGAFEDCVQDPICAGETVRSYMTKFAQDCNNDGVINCDDFARIHIFGGFGCSAPVDGSRFYQQYLKCRASVESLSG